MHRHEYNVAVLVGDFYHFADPALVVMHAYQASENSYSVVDVDHVVSYVEGIEVVDGKLLALFHAAAYAHPVETVENFVVGVDRGFGILVHESVMDVLSFHELGKYSSLAGDDEFYPVQLGRFFAVDIHLVSGFRLAPDVFLEKVEILVETGLGRDVEALRILWFFSHRNLEKHPFKTLGLGVKIFFFI